MHLRLLKYTFFCFFLFLAGIRVSSQEHLNKLLDSLSVAHSDEETVNLAIKIASELKHSDWKRAEHYINLAGEKAGSSSKLQAEFFKNTAHIYYDRDVFDIALQYSLKAYDFYKDQFPCEQYEIENLLAVIYARLYNQERALYYLKRVYAYHKEQNNLPSSGRVLNNIGSLFLESEKPDSALIYLNRSMAILEKAEDNHSLIRVYTSMARAYESQGSRERAENYFEKALELQEKVQNPELSHYVFYTIADYYFKIGKPEQSVQYAQKAFALDVFRQGINNLEVLQILYKSNLTLGNYREAAQFFQEYDSLRESLDVEEKAINVEKQRIEHDFKTKEEINNLNDKQKRLNLIIAILGLLVVLLIFGVFLIRYKNKLVKEKLKNELNTYRENELKNQIELKNKELASKTIAETRREEIYNSVLEDLKKIKLKNGKEDTQQALNQVLNKLENNSNKAIWEEFELRFANIYESFYQNLQKRHPDLSSYDKRICALIKLNLSTKEIADITGVTIKSVENTRTRLRKKLKMSNEKIGLNQYLSTI